LHITGIVYMILSRWMTLIYIYVIHLKNCKIVCNNCKLLILLLLILYSTLFCSSCIHRHFKLKGLILQNCTFQLMPCALTPGGHPCTAETDPRNMLNKLDHIEGWKSRMTGFLSHSEVLYMLMDTSDPSYMTPQFIYGSHARATLTAELLLDRARCMPAKQLHRVEWFPNGSFKEWQAYSRRHKYWHPQNFLEYFVL
jgi:hypothetical protein